MTNLNLRPDNLLVRSMTRTELDILIAWADSEGWNPGRYDADIFWDTDPDGFITAELNGERHNLKKLNKFVINLNC